MKRVNENVKGFNESLGFKKGRFLSGIDNSDGVSVTGNNNGIVDAAETYRTEGLFEDEASGDFGRVIFGGLTLSNEWDFDVNFDLLFGNTEQHKSLGYELNVPVFGSSVDATETGVQEFTQRPLIKENRVEVIDIVSDDSDEEVEIVGFNYGCKENSEQKGVGMSYGDIENLNLGLEMYEMDCFVGESSLVAGCEGRYTREEKGKAHIDDSWLALDSDHPILLDLWPKSYFSTETIESREDFEVIAWQPTASPAIPVVAAEVRQEQVLRPRVTTNCVVLRETARRFARMNYNIENGGNGSSSQEMKPAPIKANELLGKMPGPFAEALKLVRQKTSKREAQDSIEWKPSEENRGHSVTMPLVPSLLDLSLKGLAQNAEGILSLELVPDFLRRRLTDALCDTNRMSVHILKLLVEGYPTEISVKNSSWLTETQFQHIFGNFQTKNLRILKLDLCGQCMLDVAFRDTFTRSSNSFSRLAIVSLRGACRLSDSGLKELLVAAPALRSINLGQCSLLTCDGINFIADYLGSNLRELYIDDCQKIDAMRILSSFKKFRCMEVLSVANVQTVTDQFISEVIKACGQSIKELDLANCLELTDSSLKIIGSSCVNLCSLNISNLHNLTDIGVEYLANGCRSIQKLKLCRNGFSDEAMAAFMQSSGGSLMELSLNNVTKVGSNTALSLAGYSKKLSSLDISWCRRITNEALGLIVDNCSSLKLLKIFGCGQITSVFVNGHSNPLVRIIGLNMTPILENIEPEEVLLCHSPLSVCTLPEVDSTNDS
ncbi:uncharacterized protein LOC142545134 [Primulina tabacum]|uniref:uncharacterized protein LOC142545134 n=1 Tax=Primulina tabacum TaxID=48773 RepID=UPI003F5AB3E2